MGWFFSKPAPPPEDQASQKDKFMLKLKVSRDRVEKRVASTETEIQGYSSQLRQLLQDGRRDDAKRVLKIRKMKENALEVARAGQAKLELMINELDIQSAQQEVLQGLDAGTAALDEVNKAMPLHTVQAILAAADEALAQHQEVDAVISGTSMYGAEDEAAVEADLAALDAGIAGEPAAAAAAGGAALDTGLMPSAPTHAVEGGAAGVRAPVPARQPAPVAVPA